ncbi:MAG: ATPase [Deltaproteobacteria bacterium]|nr:MAG: ATPase [Deltaproteobacteria bacterium]
MDKLPDHKELEKELSEYLSKKYGGRVKIISPLVFPRPDKDQSDTSEGKKEKDPIPDFDLLPEELESYLRSYVVKQRDAIAVLSTKICTHFNRIRYAKENNKKGISNNVGVIKNNVLMIGPTGVGKTYIVKLIAQKLGVPFVKGDATKFSETGYVGGDVEDLVRDLVHEAEDNTELAENGIIYIDEIDKIASSRNIIGHDVSRTGVQRALLKPMEETEVDLRVPHDPVAQLQAIEHYRRTGKRQRRVVNTRNILFIVSGAFNGLAEIIRNRLQKQGIGFEADVMSQEVPWDILKQVTPQDLVEFGFESEFIGRLPVIVVFDELTRDDLVEILKNPNTPVILSKRLDFRAYNIDIEFEDEALEKIADIASAQKTGARGLVNAIEKVLIPFEKRLPSTNIKEFVVTPEVVDNPDEQLAHLLENHDDPEFMIRFETARRERIGQIQSYIRERINEFKGKRAIEIYTERIEIIISIYFKNLVDINTAFEIFYEMYDKIKNEEMNLSERMDVGISFDDSAIDAIIKRAIETEESTDDIAFQVAKGLEYGLKLVRDRSGIDNFVLNKDAITDMDSYINGLIKRYYREGIRQD